MQTLKEFVNSNELMVVAHRGSSGTAPENSLAAYKEAISAGVSMIEVDIQITKDNQLISYHDFFPVGLNKKISELNYNEIKDIKIGDGYESKYSNERIPLLSQILELIKDKCFLMIEIKTLTGEKFKESCNSLLKIIEDYNYSDYTIFGSFNYLALSQIKQFDSKYHIAAIKIPNDKSLPSEIKKVTGCDAFICSLEELTAEIAEDAKSNGIFTGIYSVETKYHLETALDFGARAIATNYPNKIINLLKEKELKNKI